MSTKGAGKRIIASRVSKGDALRVSLAAPHGNAPMARVSKAYSFAGEL